MLRFVPRPAPSRAAAWLSPVAATALTVIAGFVLFASLGKDPVAALHAFFVQPLATRYGVGEWLLKASPLALIAVGLAAGYRANVWNIGAEGQMTVGAMAGGAVALAHGDGASMLILPLMLIAGAAGGMGWAAIPAVLRTRFRASEILTSLMLVYIATLWLSYMVHGPWRDPEGFNFPQSRLFDPAVLLPVLVAGTRINAGLLVTLAVVAVAWLFMQTRLTGYRMRVAGLAPGAANYAGIAESGTVWRGMLIGGACAGLAGVGEVAGPIGQLLPSISPGYGFTAIIVAFVGRLHPAGIVAASLLMSLLYLGGEAAQITLGLPSAVTGLFQGTLLFLMLAADVFIHYRLERVRRPVTASVRA